ncbi:phage major capsid protein (plasmid) [Halobacterium sp. GSL-19]|uniref:phage major capsid protein n=1 Tax=Halobacterium sp. GSL-19 TaxID=2812551 RepID=UPI0019646E64|nr:phage major capsid protein [Halobacterium sp. GSL-19]QRY21750.1 phage major capsid protein [Halobacterium sp. GSL-19]
MQDTRKQNEDALAKLNTTDMAGGVVPRDIFEEFYQTVVDSAELLDGARTETLARPQMDLPRISVGERMRRGANEGTGDAGTATVNTDAVPMDVEKGTLSYDLTRESVDDTVDDIDELVLDMLARQFAVDTQDLAINGDTSSEDAFLTQNDGWLKLLANAADTNTYSHVDANGDPQPINTTLFDETIQTLPNKYLRSDRFEPVFFANENQVQSYRMTLTEREDPLGSAVIFGDEDITPFSYDIVGVAAWPEDQLVFTHPQNFIYALYDQLEIRVLDDTDKVAENDLFARYFLRARDDFAVEDEQAAVHVTDIQT